MGKKAKIALIVGLSVAGGLVGITTITVLAVMIPYLMKISQFKAKAIVDQVQGGAWNVTSTATNNLGVGAAPRLWVVITAASPNYTLQFVGADGVVYSVTTTFTSISNDTNTVTYTAGQRVAIWTRDNTMLNWNLVIKEGTTVYYNGQLSPSLP